MRFYALVDLQYMVLAFFFGLAALFLVYMAWGSYPLRRLPQSKEEIEKKEGHEIESGHDVEKNPMAPFLIYVYAGVIIWSIGYMIYAAITGAVF
ncbi:MAG: hypothetical protein HY697_04855 [Deltaproteobacteria bacterium]|nr:hypothetical protein [Deltaproteobacteria bacterium]